MEFTPFSFDYLFNFQRVQGNEARPAVLCIERGSLLAEYRLFRVLAVAIIEIRTDKGVFKRNRHMELGSAVFVHNIRNDMGDAALPAQQSSEQSLVPGYCGLCLQIPQRTTPIDSQL